jgi:hypothetical protein
MKLLGHNWFQLICFEKLLVALCLTGLLLLLPSCGHVSRPKKKALFDWALVEARFPDIPLPVGIQQDLINSQDLGFHKSVFVYTAQQTYEELVMFYETEMERYGWQKIVSFDRPQTSIYFEKPRRSALVVIETASKKGLRVSVYSGRKETVAL